mmetsp:Transcript_18292/g.44049  ORF Transcript_18292/g.44049 Transcript_18292/m.44049 type:complete len:349 (-) Transcript_18292:148-1194(-)
MLKIAQDAQVASGHTCPIHHVAHDYFGMRLATCSSDKTIRVFEKGEDDKWVLASQWNAHKGVIWKVGWAHPEFGQVLASCSDDRTVMIWSEIGGGTPDSKLTFQLMATLTDFEKGVRCITFAPNHMGLILASGCNDGKVRLHHGSATKLQEWTLQSDFSPDLDHPATAAGFSTAGLSIYVTGLSWNKNRGDCAMLAVGWWRGGEPGMTMSNVAVWGFHTERKTWGLVTRLELELDRRGSMAEVRDVDWANSCGRTTHVIAAAVGSTVQVWKLPSLSGWPIRKLEPVVPLPLPEVREAGAASALTFWQVGWSVTGTSLAASAEDGHVAVWKLDMAGHLQLHAALDPETK